MMTDDEPKTIPEEIRRMTAARISILALALSAMMGCAGDRATDATIWHHRDGSAVSAVELAQSRAACRKAAMRTDRYLTPFPSGNPAYHPGIFGNPAVAKSYGFVQSTDGTWHVSQAWRG